MPLRSKARQPASQVDAVRSLQVRGRRADHTAERPDQRGGPTLGDGHRQTALAAHRGDLRAGEAGPDHEHPARPRVQSRHQPGRVVAGAQRAHAGQAGLLGTRPGPGPDPGGDQHPVERDVRAVGQEHPFAGQVQSGGPDTQPPVRVQGAASGQRRVLRRNPAEQHLLRQARPVVRLVALLADQGQRAGEPLVTQHLRGAQPGQAGTDDDDASDRVGGRGAERRCAVITGHGGPHPPRRRRCPRRG